MTKTKPEANQKAAGQTSKAQVKSAAPALLIALQSKFALFDGPIWKEHWPAGPVVAAAKVELVEAKVESTTDKVGKASLDASNLSTGSYTLKLTPAQGNTWTAADRNKYTSDKANTLRYEPVELTVSVSVKGAALTVDKVEVQDNLRSKVYAKVTGNSIVIDWRPAWIASPNMGTRPKSATLDMILVHRTGKKPIGSPINTFINKDSTSAHFLIDTNGHVIQLVAETHRAFHAGTSWWNGTKDLNNVAIGIEIVNDGGAFTNQQYDVLTELLTRLMKDHSITRHGILAHSDIRVGTGNVALSSDRGVCPGPDFDWKMLMEKNLSSKPNTELYSEDGIDSEYGAFFKDNPKGKLSSGQQDKSLVSPSTKKPYGVIEALQSDLSTIGYSINSKDGVTKTGVYDTATQAAVDRFRRHFMSGLVKLTGNLDPTFDRATAIAMKRVIKDRAT